MTRHSIIIETNKLRCFARTIIPVVLRDEELILKKPGSTRHKSTVYVVRSRNNRCGLLPFVLKMRDLEHPEMSGILDEFQNLRILQDSLRGNGLQNSIPYPLKYDSQINCSATTELDGSSVQREVYLRLITGINRRRLFFLYSAITAWIGQFQCATKLSSYVDVSNELNEALSQLVICPGLPSGARQVFEVALQTALDCSTQISAVFCHGDFALRNILITEENRIRVIDWEYMTVGHPVTDPIFLISNIQLAARYLGRLELVIEVSEAILHTWYKYARAFGISHDVIGGLAIAGMLERMLKIARMMNVVSRKRVFSYFIAVGLRILKREWMY